MDSKEEKFWSLDSKTSKEAIKTSKFFAGFMIVYQIVLLLGIHKGQMLIASAKGEVFQLNEFLLSVSFISVSVTTILLVVYLFTRSFWYTVILAFIFTFEVVADFLDGLQDGFSNEDIYGLFSVTSLFTFMLAFAALSIRAIKNKEKNKAE